MSYFKNVKSYEDLKAQYKTLLKANHPDNGGNVEKMQEINCEYDALFIIWRNRHEEKTGQKVNETADSTRSQFYTQFGWEGIRHDWNRSLKEIAKIVRAYVKEKYPTYKFSVRTEYASMCQELHVEMKESPIEIYKTFEELTEDDKDKLIGKMEHNWLFKLATWNNEELKAEFERIWSENGNFYKCMNEVTQAVADDVDAFVKSYNYEDCDGMIDYFHVDFYYFGCCKNNGMYVKVVPKTARIKNRETAPESTQQSSTDTANAIPENTEAQEYEINKTKHTKTGEEIYTVKVLRKLSREEYLQTADFMKSIGGYYSRFVHAFVFHEDPTERLVPA